MITSTFDTATDIERRFEHIDTVIFKDPFSASKEIAKEIAELIREKQAQNQPCVLGLATGNSPIELYSELVRLHKHEGLSFKNVISFNLDEYYPISPDSENSFNQFMQLYLFNHVDLLPENCHIPDGCLSKDAIDDYCKDYESKIEALGGIDLQILGIGANGHIGFNESGSTEDSKTRWVALDDITIKEASPYFSGIEHTPKAAITLGVQKIMEAKRVILMAWGHKKAKIISSAIEGKVTQKVPASYLQNHSNVTFVLDHASSAKLTRVHSPERLHNLTSGAK